MWLAVGNGYLNLENVVSIHFARDDDGGLTATVETFAGHAKHYHAHEAETLRKALEALAAGPAQVG
jgi:hypothetical protein